MRDPDLEDEDVRSAGRELGDDGRAVGVCGKELEGRGKCLGLPPKPNKEAKLLRAGTEPDVVDLGDWRGLLGGDCDLGRGSLAVGLGEDEEAGVSLGFGDVGCPGCGTRAYRHTGHVPEDFNQGRIHILWNGCLHGRVITICCSGSSVPNSN